jgi:hypothetical protein
LKLCVRNKVKTLLAEGVLLLRLQLSLSQQPSASIILDKVSSKNTRLCDLE